MPAPPPVQPNRKPWQIVAFGVGVMPYYLNGFYNTWFLHTHAMFWFWVVEVFTYLVMPAVIAAALLRSQSLSLGELGYHTRFRGRQNPWALIVACIVVPIFMCRASDWLNQFSYEHFPNAPGDVLFSYPQFLPPRGPASGWIRFAAVLYMALTVGVVEEFYYRGLLRVIFGRSVLGSALFVVVSTAVFTGAHFEGGREQMFLAASWGLALALLYLTTDNIWPLIIAHVINDWLWLAQS